MAAHPETKNLASNVTFQGQVEAEEYVRVKKSPVLQKIDGNLK